MLFSVPVATIEGKLYNEVLSRMVSHPGKS